MKTSLNIPEADLKELMKQFPKLTRTEAIVRAVREFNRLQQMKKLSEKLGAFSNFISLSELKRLRQSQ